MECIKLLEEFLNSFIIEDLESDKTKSLVDTRLYKTLLALLQPGDREQLSGKKLRVQISEGRVLVNDKIILDNSYRVKEGDIIKYNNKKFRIKGIDLLNAFQNLLIKCVNEINPNNIINDLFNDDLKNDQLPFLIASLLRLEFKLENCEVNHPVRFNSLKFLEKNLNQVFQKNNISSKISTSAKIIKLKEIYDSNKTFLSQIIINLDNIYKLDNLQQTLRKHINQQEFKLFFKPFIPVELLRSDELDLLFKPINEARKTENETARKQLYNDARKNIIKYKKNAEQLNLEFVIEFLIPLADKLISILNIETYGTTEARTDFVIKKISKKYPFFNLGEIDLQVKIINKGEGYATNLCLKAESKDLKVINNNNFIGDLPPGEMTFTLPVEIKKKSSNLDPTIEFGVDWINLDNTHLQKSFSITFESQNENIPWENLKAKKPYSLKAISDKEKLLGRDVILDELIENFQNDEIDSFILFGQRRVGKTSIVKSLRNWFEKLINMNVIMVYVDCTNVRDSNVTKSISQLGKSICTDLLSRLQKKAFNNYSAITALKKVHVPEFENSLTPLTIFLQELINIIPNYKFIIAIDEFDELQYEVYKPGDISDTLFRNLRGLNNNFPNLGIILIGSEKMPKIYNWHGEQLNNWKNRAVDTFDRETQFESFKKLVIIPAKGYIQFTEDAINEIYEFSSGNPYFTNVICGWIFDRCYVKRDSEVDKHDVHKAIEYSLKKEAKTSFQHFWLDGILDSPEKKDRISDLRRRTLLAIAMKLKVNNFYDVSSANRTEVIKYFNPPPSVSRNECESYIDEFFSRGIFYNYQDSLRVKPKLFEIWLAKYGKEEIVTGIADLERFLEDQELENTFELKNSEINRLNKKYYFAYRERNENELMDWFNQFGSNSKQRLVFNLLEKTRFISEENFRVELREQASKIFRDVVEEKKSNRLKRYDTLLCYFDFGYEDNEKFAEKVAEVFSILKENVVSLSKIGRYIDDEKKIILLVHPFLYNYSDLFQELDIFMKSYSEFIKKKNIIVKWLNLNGYSHLKKDIGGKLNKYEVNIELIWLNDLLIENCQFFSDKYLQLSNEEKESSKNLILEFFPSFPIYNCHDFVFEFCTPQFSLPFFWYPKVGFTPFFERAKEIYIYAESDNSDLSTEAKKIGDSLELKMLETARLVLNQTNGENWWVECVPEKIRKKCMNRWDDEKRKGEEYNYLDFIDYAEIAKQNETLKPFFFYDETKKDYTQISKDKGTNWLSKLNEIRKIYSHPVREEKISEEDLLYLKKMKDWFYKNNVKLKI